MGIGSGRGDKWIPKKLGVGWTVLGGWSQMKSQVQGKGLREREEPEKAEWVEEVGHRVLCGKGVLRGGLLSK